MHDPLEKTTNANSLPINSLYAITGNVIYIAGRFGIILCLTKYFPSDQVGQLIYALAIVTPISHFFNIEVRSVYVTDTKGRFNAGDALVFRCGSNAFFLLVLFAMVYGCRVSGVQLDSGCILVAGAVRAAESWADVYLGVFQKHEKMKFAAFSQALKTMLVLAWVIVIAHKTSNVVTVLWGWFAATAIVIITLDRYWANKMTSICFRYDRHKLVALLKSAFPLGMFVTISILNSWAPTYFIKYQLDYASVAYFGVVMNYVAALAAVQNGMNQSILARWSQYYVTDRKRFWKLLAMVLALSLAGVAVVLALVAWRGRWILLTFHKNEYAQYAHIFVLMIAVSAAILAGMILGDAIIACQRFLSRMIAVGAGLAINLIGCAFLIPRYGLAGAAASIAASAITIVLVCVIVLIQAGKSERRIENLT